MSKEQQIKRRIKKNIYLKYYLVVFLLLFLVVSAASYFYFKPRVEFESPFIENIESQRAKEEKSGMEKTDSVRLYKPPGENQLSDNEKLRKETMLVEVESTIKKYIKDYNGELLDLYMDKNGTIYVDFSGELKKNFNGDASDEYQIIAGMYESIQKAILDFRTLKILLDGKEVESIGGHIDISRQIGEGIKGIEQQKTDRYF